MTACARTGYWRGLWVWSARWSRRCWSRRTRSWCGCVRGGGTLLAAGCAGGGLAAMTAGKEPAGGGRLISGSTKAYVEAEAPRVDCRRHGVVVVGVPWARHGSRFTRAFEQQVAWLATHCSKTAVCELMRISWYTVGRIIERVVADERVRQGDPLEGLTRIGIDELSFRKGQRYITVVVDHDSGRLVWAARGPRQADRARVLRPARRRARRPDRADLERPGRVDHPGGQGALPAGDALPRSLPRRRARQQRARRGTARGLAAGPPAPATRPAPAGSKAPAGRSGSDPNGSPNASRRSSPRSNTSTAASTAPTSSKRNSGSSSTAAPTRPSRSSRPGSSGHAAAESPSFVKLAKTITANKAGHRRDAHPPALERPHRGAQHHPPTDLPPRLRLPLRRSTDRARDAHRRRPTAAAPRPLMTHGNVRSSL